MTMIKRCFFLLFITVVICAQDEQAVEEPNDNDEISYSSTGNPEEKLLENDGDEHKSEREHAQDTVNDEFDNKDEESLNADNTISSDTDENNANLREGSSSKRTKKQNFVYVPVPLKSKKQKDKIIAITINMYVPGGQPLFGKFKSLKSCSRACSKNPSCYAADYDKWLHKCYMHTNVTACANRQIHPSITHLSKVPCFRSHLPTDTSRAILGAQMFYGLEQKGIQDIKTCMKKCSTLGGGIARIVNTMATAPQLCVAINFDFSTHKCYVFPPLVNGLRLCSFDSGTPSMTGPVVPATQGSFTPQISSKLLVANPFVITIFMCPSSITTRT